MDEPIFFAQTLGAKTRQLYEQNLRTLNNGEPPKDLDFLSDVRGVLDKLERYVPNTRRTFLITILSALRYTNSRLYYEYYPCSIRLAMMNDLLKPCTITWNDVESMIQHQTRFLPRTFETNRAYECLLDIFILSLYAYQPPANTLDYIEMDVAPCRDIGHQYFEGEFSNNGERCQLVKELKDIMGLYFSQRPVSSSLLVRQNGQPLKNAHDITRRLSNMFNRKVCARTLKKLYVLHLA